MTFFSRLHTKFKVLKIIFIYTAKIYIYPAKLPNDLYHLHFYTYFIGVTEPARAWPQNWAWGSQPLWPPLYGPDQTNFTTQDSN